VTANSNQPILPLEGLSQTTARVSVNKQPTVAATHPGPGHNLMVRAGDLLGRFAPQHERRHIDDRVRDAQSIRAANPDCLRAFPVVEGPGGATLADGANLIAAVCEIDPNRLVLTTSVSEAEALRIRSQDNATRDRREPMAPARRALLLRRTGMSNSAIATELCISVTPSSENEENGEGADKDTLSIPRITQLCDAALAEEAFTDLAKIIKEPARIPISFWEAFSKTIKAQAKCRVAKGDAARDGADTLSTKAKGLIERGVKYEYKEIAKKLELNDLREPKPRGRKVGEPTPVSGTSERIYVARDRKGGAAINLPSGLSSADVEKVIALVIETVRAIILDNPQPKRS
jgi:hypothetical protein